jgi:hypothetical protein
MAKNEGKFEMTDINKVIEEFNLKGNLTDRNSLVKELKAKLAELHPDRFGGSFKDDNHKKAYYTINEALEFLETSKDQPKSLIPVDALPSILEAVTKAVAPSRERIVQDLKIECRHQVKTDNWRRFFLPRITTGGLAAVLTGLLSYSRITDGLWSLDSPTHLVILIVIVYLIIFLIFTWWIEKTNEARIEWLMSEAGGIVLLRDTVREYSKPNATGNSFTFLNMKSVVISHLSPHGILSSIISKMGMKYGVSENITKLHIESCIDKGLLTKSEKKSLNQEYNIRQDLLEELLG